MRGENPSIAICEVNIYKSIIWGKIQVVLLLLPSCMKPKIVLEISTDLSLTKLSLINLSQLFDAIDLS